MDKNACYIVNDLLEVLDELTVMMRELNPGATEQHRRIAFFLTRIDRQVKETLATLERT